MYGQKVNRVRYSLVYVFGKVGWMKRISGLKL